MTNTNNSSVRGRKAEFQTGYRSVLVRDELKQRLIQWRADRNLTDSHYDRCLVSALVELGLAPENENRLIQILGRAVARDFELSSSALTGNRPHTESCAKEARSLKQNA